jgi:hypothetical protein
MKHDSYEFKLQIVFVIKKQLLQIKKKNGVK